MLERKRILISAYAFSPFRGSECAVGWNIVTRLAKFHDVTVLCGDLANSRPMKADLQRYFMENPPIHGLTVQYIEPGCFIRVFEKIHNIPGLWPVYYLAYNLWQRKAFHAARKLHAIKPFDLIHQLNMIGYREPGYLWRLPAPFIWGPVGGGANISPEFCSLFSLSGRITIPLRMIFNEIQKRLAWRSMRAARKARLVWAVTPDDLMMIRDVWKVEAEQMLEVGSVIHHDRKPIQWQYAEPLRIVWSGMHTPGKALPIVLNAVSATDIREKVRIDVLGDGVEANAWKELANKLEISDIVTWWGMLPRNKALDVMSQCHLMACSSLKEATSNVVLEALSFGLPVICHDTCGMGIAINDNCGIKIPLLNPETSIKGFREAIRELLSNPDKIGKLSRGALKRAEEISWDRNVEVITREYKKTMAPLPSQFKK